MQNISEKCQVGNSEKLGRHLIAAIDIIPGDVILEEIPLLVAPHWECEQMKCSKCFKDSFVICKKCQIFPLCLECQCHDEFDCEFFQKAENISKNLLVEHYAIFAPLKYLLLMENPKTAQDTEHSLMHPINLDDYRESDEWVEHQTKIIEPIVSSGICDRLIKVKVDAELLHKLCILIDANSFEIINSDGVSLKGMYIYASKFPHSCISNTVIAIDDNFQMKIYASVPIKCGGVIYNSYTNPLMGTSQRKHHLKITRHLDCSCKRCLDPTEMGANMSSMKCKNCPDGYSVCEPNEPATWTCEKCSATTDAMEVHKLLAEVGEEMVFANGDIRIYEMLLAKYSSFFHPNHFLIIDMKQNIATILGAILMDPVCSPGKKVLQRKIEICEEILPVVQAVSPGLSKLYAIALYEYLTPFIELAEMDFKDKDISVDEYLKKLRMAKDLCAEVVQMLSYEPANSPEGHLLGRIRMEQRNIEENINKNSSVGHN